MKQIGEFNADNGGKFNLVFFGVVMQEGKDYLLPRGGNFLENLMVGKAHKHLLPYFEDSITEEGGFAQPDPSKLPIPFGYKLVWGIDRDYLVYNYVFLKEHINVDNSDTWFDTKEKAIALIEQLKKPTHFPPKGLQNIMIQVRQNCINDRVEFELDVMFPDTRTEEYTIKIEAESDPSYAKVAVLAHNKWAVLNHENKQTGKFKVTVSRKDCNTLQYENYTSTCNHFGHPTNCPPNERKLSIDKAFQLGVEQKVTVDGNLLDCPINMYNKNTEVVGFSTYKPIAFPVTVHYQPNCGAECHGWSELYQQESN